MYDGQSKTYENIDALIKAAEVLERNEILSKNRKLSDESSKGPIYTNQKSETNCQQMKKKCNSNRTLYMNGKSKSGFSDNLLETIKCIEELRKDERWYSILENKVKSDNRALYQELNNLKRKLNKIKHMTSKNKKSRVIDKSYEDEDTSTASEDEDYNKYDSKIISDNMDDVTDDASECEEITYENTWPKNVSPDNHPISSKKNGVPLLPDRKRKHSAHNPHSPDLLQIKHPSLKNSSMTKLSSSIWKNCRIQNPKCTKSINASHYGLIPAPNCEVSSKVHRIV